MESRPEEEPFDFGLPRSLLRNWPGVHPRRWTLRLGDVPLLAEHAPRLMERSVPTEQVEWAAGILGRPHCGVPAAPSHLSDGPSAVAALDAAQAAVAEALVLFIPVGNGREEGDAPSGIGWWLGLYHFALAELHLGRAEALDTPVGELFALSSASAASFGSSFTAPTYAERDLIDSLDSPADPPAKVGLNTPDGASPRSV